MQNNFTRPPVPKPQKPVNTVVFVVAICVALGCSLTIFWIVLASVSAGDSGLLSKVLIVLLLALFVGGTFAVAEIPWGLRSLRDWRRPKVLGTVLSAITGAVALAVGLPAVLGPPAATEKTVDEVRRRLEEAGVTRGEKSLVEKHIAGKWGEPGCLVTYRFSLEQGLLKISSEASVAGQSPLSMELGTEPGAGARIVASVVMPLAERGDQHEFVYEAIGAREFLTWKIKKRESTLRLDRCEVR